MKYILNINSFLNHFNLIIFNFILIISPSFSSLFCPYTAYPSSDTDFEKLRVEAQTLDDPIQLGQPIYRLKRAASINLDFEEDIGSEEKDGFYSPIGEKPFRLFTRALSSECPKRGCLHELALAEPRVPGTLFYHTDTIMGKVIPPGFLTVEANPRLYCAIVSDDCGANVPIYRHFKMVGPRVYYAYSTSPDVEIPGNFTREQMPMCFGWSLERPNPESLIKLKNREASPLNKNKINEEKKEKKTKKNKIEENEEINNNLKISQNKEVKIIMEMDENKKDDEMINMKEIDECLNISPLSNLIEENSKFAKLIEYDNGKLGTLHDHLYTTNNSVSSEYKNNSQLGYVLTEPVRSKCPEKCLIKLGQMLTNRRKNTFIFHFSSLITFYFTFYFSHFLLRHSIYFSTLCPITSLNCITNTI
uniref:Uncharacterized protein n=1 Tax=Meloidogyne enterolobii TaxID=390850 RepID=A0A6V7W042_MELEN|nr:unnamed protein product [Meloidogyne enterolobii]